MSSNPYEAPRAPVQDIARVVDNSELLDEPRRVPAGNGWQWFATAWEMLKTAPGPWAVLVLITIGVSFTAQLIPFIGGLLQQAVNPFSSAGVAAMGDALRVGRPPNMAEIMDQVMKRASQLAIVAAIMVGATICIAVMAVVFFVFVSHGKENAGLLVALAGLIFLVLYLPLIMATYFAPALICLHDKSAVDAMRMSLRACWRNFWAFTVMGLCGMGLALLATLPLLLGWILFIPLLFIVTYCAYRDIFFEA